MRILSGIIDWLKDKDRAHSKLYMLSCLFLACYFITIMLNIRYQLGTNLLTLVITAFFMLILYPYNKKKPLFKVKKELRFLAWGLICVTFLLSLASLFMFAIQLEATVGNRRIGVYQNRLWGWCNPNTGSIVAVCNIMLTLLLLFVYRPTKKQRIFLYANLFIQLSYIVLSWSRGSIVSLLWMLFLSTLFLLFQKMQKGGTLHLQPKLKKALMAIFIPTFVTVTTLASIFILAKGYSYLPSIVEKVLPQKIEEHSEESASVQAMQKKDVPVPHQKDRALTPIDISRDEPIEMSNSRMKVWLYVYDRLIERPLFGMSYARINHDIYEEFGYVNTHNVYIQMLVSNGIVGLLILIAIAIFYFAAMFRYFVRYRDDHSAYTINILLFAFITALFINGLFEARIIVGFSFRNAAFWLALHYQMYLVSHYEWLHGIETFTDKTTIANELLLHPY